MQTLKEIVNAICYARRINQRQLRELYNQKYGKNVFQSTFNKTINNNNMKYCQFVELLDVVGYEIKLVDKGFNNPNNPKQYSIFNE